MSEDIFELEERMKRGDARGAAQAAVRLGPPSFAIEELRRAYLSLLDQRGYFVETQEQVAASIREIREVGPGFDLYDLSEALAVFT